MKPLEVAIKMEMDGKAFYQAAGEKCGDDLGKALFVRLANEEDFHAAKAREIADALMAGEKPLAIEESLDNGEKLTSIFTSARKAMSRRGKVGVNEMDVVARALELEEMSRKFYEEHVSTAESEFEKRFFNALMAEEHGHYLSLVDYREYLTDPTGWFTKTEHISLDGG